MYLANKIMVMEMFVYLGIEDIVGVFTVRCDFGPFLTLHFAVRFN